MSRYNILQFDELGSTNDYGLENLGSLGDRQVILAEKQTKGHGRFDRKWVSHVPGNIYMSLVLKPELAQVEHLVSLTHYMSLKICEVLEGYKVTGKIKWPNDVQVEGSKISGLLSESKVTENEIKGYVLGVGINLNMKQDDIKDIDQPVTSLNLEIGEAVDRGGFLQKLLGAFFGEYDAFLEKGFVSIKERYIGRNTFIGKQVMVAVMDKQIEGTAEGFADDGALLIDVGGEVINISAGEVTSVR